MKRLAPVLLGAAVALASCASDTVAVGPDAADAAGRGGWRTRDGGGEAPRPAGRDEVQEEILTVPPRDPSTVVAVPREAYDPIDRFFDHEGYLLGDRIEVDCSVEPFMARMVGLAYADDLGKYVLREERDEGDAHLVRLLNMAEGPNYQPSLIPRATFGSQTGFREQAAGQRLHPFFELVATGEIVVRFHANSSPDRPVFFRARATGLPTMADPAVPKDCIYANANRRRRVRGPVLDLRLEIRRESDGRWTPVVADPGEGGDGGR